MSVHARWNCVKEPAVRWDHSASSSRGGFLQRLDLSHVSATDVDWAPLVDILADKKGYLFRADLPEVNPGDVSVQIQSNMLYISGERKFQRVDHNKKHLRLERPHGYFVRRFSLPDDASRTNFRATFKKGVLEVRLPKVRPHEVEKNHPQQITVKVA